MTTMAPTRPTERHGCRVRLTAEPAAAAEARRQVRATLAACSASVDPDVAVLLASDLVTDAIQHQAGGSIALDVCCDRSRLRVYVHGTSDPGPGLVLVAALSDEWGSYRTPWGRATYFALTSRR
jgi:hypothetical protein